MLLPRNPQFGSKASPRFSQIETFDFYVANTGVGRQKITSLSHRVSGCNDVQSRLPMKPRVKAKRGGPNQTSRLRHFCTRISGRRTYIRTLKSFPA